MTIIGKSSCQPIRDCGIGKYGNIKTSSKTIFVDRQYVKTDSNGGQARPYQSIDDALSAAPSGAHIAVAAGEYQENLTIDKAVTLDGRCPGLVTVRGYKTDRKAAIMVTAAESTIRGMTVTGVKFGIIVGYADKVIVEQCAVTDNKHFGLSAVGKAGLTVRRTLVARNAGIGVEVGTESRASLDACVVRDTREKNISRGQEKLWTAWGVWAYDRAEVTVKHSLVTANGMGGIVLTQKSKGTVIGSEVSDTWDKNEPRGEGPGMGIYSGSSLTIQGSLVKNSRVVGLAVLDSSVVLVSSVIHNTLPRRYDQSGGYGIYTRSDSASTPCKLTVKDSLISRSTNRGIVFINGGQANIERSVISGTGTTGGKDTRTIGIYAFTETAAENPRPARTTMTFNHSVVEGGQYGGIWTDDGIAMTIYRSVVRDISIPPKSILEIGFGIWSMETLKMTKLGYHSSVVVRESLVERIEGFGISTFRNGRMKVERSLVRDALPVSAPGASSVGIAAVSVGEDPALSGVVLDVQDSAVEKMAGEGIHVEGGRATVSRTMVTDTRLPFGYGLSVNRPDKAPATELLLTRALVQNSAQAGVVFHGGKGKVCRSVFGKNKYAVVLENGTAPVICEDNRYVENERNGVAFGQGLKPARVPEVSKIKIP